MTLAPSTRLGPYEIVALLGAGGMGEVYRARDPRLGRDVAIKVLPAEVANDPERLRRFEQEARAASALNHPNILTVHDLGAHEGLAYLVTELLEGESLRELLRKGAVPVRRAVELTAQIAGGLAAAHEMGIVHRDIKPENLFLTQHGAAKILDFGLAHVASPLTSASELARAPTVEALTGEGTVLGTVGYMSPEQVRGERADARSDLFALGCVLYELATGRRAFDRATSAETMTAILREEPSELGTSSSSLTPALRRLVRRALAKDPADRFPSLREFALQLGEAFDAEPATRPRRATMVIAGIAVAIASVTAVWLQRRAAPAVPGAGPATRVASIAVLPLENLSGDGGFDYLRLALADGMTTILTRTPSLAVRPFSRSRAMTAANVDPAEAGRTLQAEAVLTGHLLAEGHDLKLALEVFAVEENRVLWRQSFAVARDDLLALDHEVARRLESELLPALGLAPAPRGEAAVPTHAEGYELFLRAVSRPWADTGAIELLERSLALDPSFAPAWAELGYRVYQEAHFGQGGRAAIERSLAASQRALELDPESIEAVIGLVFARTEAGQLEPAFDSAAALVVRRPDSAAARAGLAYTLRYGGLLAEAAAVCDAGLELDSRESRLGHCAWIALERGDPERVRVYMRTRVESEWHRFLEFYLALHAGDLVGARKWAPTFAGPSWGLDAAKAYLAGAPPEEVRRLHQAYLESASRAIVDGDIDFKNAALAALIGESESALDLLRHGLELRFCAVEPLERDPLLAPLRARPEFDALRRQAAACRDRFVDHLRQVGSPYAPR